MNTTATSPLKLLVSHAEPVLAAGLTSMLRQHGDFELVAGESGLPGGSDGRIDIVVTDYDCGVRLALEARRVRGGSTMAPKILVVTTNDREHEVRLALESGVHGYVLLRSAMDELACAVRMLGNGMRFLSMEVSQRMAESLTREALTARETEVLQLLASGLCNKSIARQLLIGVGTVKAHVRGIMGKLEAASRTQAVSVAARRGLIHADVRPQAAPRPAATVPVYDAWHPSRVHQVQAALSA